ncbi:MAG TPA: hypothetical protein VEC06_12135 [Paucimonas sp.]|nr:hypothetical protein [Paucimonas sp.]
MRFSGDGGYFDNINVVMGDHPARKNPAWEKRSAKPERYIDNTFISSDDWRKTRDELVHFDLFPTLLEFAGIEAAHGRPGLSYSVFKTTAPSPAGHRFEEMQRALLRPSSPYTALWAKQRQM